MRKPQMKCRVGVRRVIKPQNFIWFTAEPEVATEISEFGQVRLGASGEVEGVKIAGDYLLIVDPRFDFEEVVQWLTEHYREPQTRNPTSSRIPRSTSMGYAEWVVAGLERAASSQEVRDWSLSAYSRGKEQGYFISHDQTLRAVVVTGHAIQDFIVVYYGPSTLFDTYTHHPKVWEQYITFDPEDITGVVKFIREHLRGEQK